jgi:periplasmic copper chaperone A
MQLSIRRFIAATVAATGMVWSAWGGTPVFAHIDPDPKEAPAGSVQSVGFTVEHGCDGSATVQLDMRLPEGVTDAVPEPPAGWTGGVDGRVVTFSGGP